MQSGGQAINSTNDFLSGVIAKCIAENEADYFLSFSAPPAMHPDEYHGLKITVDRPGAIARTRTGYYSEP